VIDTKVGSLVLAKIEKNIKKRVTFKSWGEGLNL